MSDFKFEFEWTFVAFAFHKTLMNLLFIRLPGIIVAHGDILK